jgi:fibronectin-binding autotransporter adhesin
MKSPNSIYKVVSFFSTFPNRTSFLKTTFALFLTSSLFVKAADKFWVPTLSSNWGTSSNWNPTGVPLSSDRANIQNGGTCVIPAATSASASFLDNRGSTLDIQTGSSLTTTGASLSGGGVATVAGTWNINGRVGIGDQSRGVLNIVSGGTVNSTTVNVYNNSAVNLKGTWTINALYGGTATIDVNSGGVLTTAAYSPLGDQPGTRCQVLIDSGGIWNTPTDINLGVVGSGNLRITGTGRVNVNGGAGAVNLSSSSSGSGSVSFGDGASAVPGVLSAAKIVGKNSLTQGWANVWLNHGGSFTLAIPLQGNLRITKDNWGITTVNGNNSYTGDTQINKGTIKLGSTTALGSTTGKLMIDLDSILDLAGFNLAKKGLGGQTVSWQRPTIHSSVPGAVKLTINGDFSANQRSLAYSGRINDGNGIVSLEKVSGETLTLAGPSNFSGGTIIREGLLILGGNTSAGTGPITILAGALQLEPGVIIANPVILEGGQMEFGLAAGDSLVGRSLASSEEGGSVSSATLLGGTLINPACKYIHKEVDYFA